MTTQDLDIVPRIEARNVARLMRVLEDLDARLRDEAGRDIPPDRKALHGSGQIRLTTRRGPLDVLGCLHDGRSYVDLLPHTEELTDGELRLRVVDLPTLIELKSDTGRVRDQLLLPLLLALQRERAGE